MLMLFMGVYPRPFLDRSKGAIEEIRARVAAPTGGTFASVDAVRRHVRTNPNEAEVR
jgi:hypothetical protein